MSKSKMLSKSVETVMNNNRDKILRFDEDTGETRGQLVYSRELIQQSLNKSTSK